MKLSLCVSLSKQVCFYHREKPYMQQKYASETLLKTRYDICALPFSTKLVALLQGKLDWFGLMVPWWPLLIFLCTTVLVLLAQSMVTEKPSNITVNHIWLKKKFSRFQVTSYSRKLFVHLNLWRRVCSFTALPFFIEFGGILSARNSDKATVYNKVPRAACEA